ncbi:MAG TPA: hypothetical protein PLU71_03230 [Candidatus Dependentiae bacterium]|nr:hypothetical protein [Candidatus Dependentiae bacterium]HRQ62844.1 hypothetical protein [Candidatus Dependentiae bacterium]
MKKIFLALFIVCPIPLNAGNDEIQKQIIEQTTELTSRQQFTVNLLNYVFRWSNRPAPRIVDPSHVTQRSINQAMQIVDQRHEQLQNTLEQLQQIAKNRQQREQRIKNIRTIAITVGIISSGVAAGLIGYSAYAWFNS